MASLFASPRTRLLLCALGVSVLAACSSSGAAAELTSSPPATANGHHYVYAAGTVARSSWPAPCGLLTTDSAAAALSTAVTAKRFHERCYYIPGNDTFPTLTVTILGIGSDQRSAFDGVRRANAARTPKAVTGVGRAAVVYTLAGSATVNVDVLADQGLFEIALRYPARDESSPTQASAILVQVGRVLAAEFES